MSILITGVNGFVGKALYQYLNGKSTITGLSRSNPQNLNNIVCIDLTNETETLEFLKNYTGEKISTIVHLASRMANKDNLTDVTVLNDNVAMAKNVALIAKTNNVNHIINLSSSSVYPNVNGTFDELSIVDPGQNSDCVYGLSKYNSEIILNYFLAGSETKVTHLRTAIIYGAGMDETRIIPVLENELKQKGTVTLFGNGERTLNLIHVGRLTEIICFFIKKAVHGVFNVAEECISLLNLAKKIVISNGFTEDVILLRPEGNRNRFTLNTDKLSAINKE